MSGPPSPAWDPDLSAPTPRRPGVATCGEAARLTGSFLLLTQHSVPPPVCLSAAGPRGHRLSPQSPTLQREKARHSDLPGHAWDLAAQRLGQSQSSLPSNAGTVPTPGGGQRGQRSKVFAPLSYKAHSSVVSAGRVGGLQPRGSAAAGGPSVTERRTENRCTGPGPRGAQPRSR